MAMENYRFPSQIYNVGETGISTVQKQGHIIGLEGRTHISTATWWERGKMLQYAVLELGMIL
jgi:hypothetical protein